jgi:hypothetical protein
MTRSILAVVVLMVAMASAQVAQAQPGQTPPAPTAPPGQPYPQPGGQWHAPPAGNYHLLTHEEHELLARGEIDSGAHIAGGLVGAFFGLGIGHAVQGRFGEKGWIFLVGEVGSMIVLVSAFASCVDELSCERQSGWILAGFAGLVGFRIWELIDVWVGPATHNNRVRAARAKAYGAHYGLYVAPPLSSDGGTGGVAGLTLRF